MKSTKKKDITGTNLKCKFCSSEQAYIRLEDRRYMVNCPVCQQEYLLSEQHTKEYTTDTLKTQYSPRMEQIRATEETSNLQPSLSI